MYSVNVPVPGRVERLAAELYPELTGFELVRERHTLVVKRLGPGPVPGVGEVDHRRALDLHREALRPALVGTPSFEARVTGIDYFARPTTGSAPVVYLTVESPGLLALHRRLVDALGAIEGLEGDDYTPHVSLARGGSLEAAERLADRSIDPVTWTASELLLWNGTFREAADRIRLPA